MNKWLSEFKQSWHDKNFICAILSYFLGYSLIIAIGLFLPLTIFIGILGAISGWQLASWSMQLSPKLKQLLFKE
jgi:NAD/NADP transhydrogenase beta subunit